HAMQRFVEFGCHHAGRQETGSFVSHVLVPLRYSGHDRALCISSCAMGQSMEVEVGIEVKEMCARINVRCARIYHCRWWQTTFFRIGLRGLGSASLSAVDSAMRRARSSFAARSFSSSVINSPRT